MSPSPKSRPTVSSWGVLFDLWQDIRLSWRLLFDRRVPWFVRTIPVLVVIYVLSPVDLLPEPILGLGELDDLAVLLLGLKLFLDASPKDIVEQHWQDLTGSRKASQEGTDHSADYIEAEYRVLRDDE